MLLLYIRTKIWYYNYGDIMVYTVTLNPALDYVLNVDELRFDDINRASNEQIYYGGKGINVSVILNRLGVDNVALGFVGGFTGGKLESLLNSDGIRTSFDHIKCGDTRINVKIRANTELDINANGPDISSDDIDALMTRLDGLNMGDYLVLAGAIPSTLPNDIYEQIMQGLDNRCINFVVDATGDLLQNVLKYHPFLIKPNHHELGDLFGVSISDVEDIEKYAKKLQDMGARNVLVSMAKNGAFLLDENGKSHTIANLEGKLVNSVGCGDSMVGGFVAGYIEKGDYSYALIMGAACGNASAFSNELATADEIKNALERYEKGNY